MIDCSTLGPQSPPDEATTHSHTSNTHLLSLLLPQIPWAFLSLRTKRLLLGIVPLTSVSDYNGYKDPKDKSMDAFSRGRTVDESMYNDQRSKSKHMFLYID
ncbi:hypothetical protein CMV_004849 [Castanea mollissima]|uniref:Uncharacterized protein n=1 Tax=Castanea mollissima TaxID=60419 RepID=A0A8J4W203_9ROSI|nr:hypothetical protein CMV_004849 [Castanea mollissima]